ncbi:MAG: Gfo/Idh/MocA family oxidoreductase [Pseudomonadota bacterium]
MTRIGIIGCGNICAAYFNLSRLFTDLQIVACADLRQQAAQDAANTYGVQALSVDDLLADPKIDIVVNLTIPAAHFAVSERALRVGKHVYSEKPLALDIGDGIKLRELAKEQGVMICCAPDTFLGGAPQHAREVIDQGQVGDITSGTCFVMSFGMEHWHPNPDFFYQKGGGPVLDIGPYYISLLIHLLGPIKRLAALANTPRKERTITSQPRAGERITVDTPTTLLALLEFASGATITLHASWDVWAHRHAPVELYGSKGSLYLPDPNFFGGEILITDKNNPPAPLPVRSHPLGLSNFGDHANYRTVGLADMARAIVDGREPRCSIDRALHCLDVMTGILQSAHSGGFVSMQTTCTRPAALTGDDARALLREDWQQHLKSIDF